MVLKQEKKWWKPQWANNDEQILCVAPKKRKKKIKRRQLWLFQLQVMERIKAVAQALNDYGKPAWLWKWIKWFYTFIFISVKIIRFIMWNKLKVFTFIFIPVKINLPLPISSPLIFFSLIWGYLLAIWAKGNLQAYPSVMRNRKFSFKEIYLITKNSPRL